MPVQHSLSIDVVVRDASSPIGFIKPKLEYDRKAIREHINIRRIKDRLQSLPLCSYDTEPTTQYDIITRQIRTILSEVCPPSPCEENLATLLHQ